MIWDQDKHWKASTGSTLEGFKLGLIIFDEMDAIRAVLFAVHSATGGKSVDFFRNFRHTYFNGFSRYNSDQVVKKHLLDQEN